MPGPDTNLVGALGVTESFLGLLRKTAHEPPLLVFFSSDMGSFSQATNLSSSYFSSNATECRVSKAALNMLMAMYMRV